jgi:hypothetical protein
VFLREFRIAIDQVKAQSDNVQCVVEIMCGCELVGNSDALMTDHRLAAFDHFGLGRPALADFHTELPVQILEFGRATQRERLRNDVERQDRGSY